MQRQQMVAFLQVMFLVVAGWGLYDFIQSDAMLTSQGEQEVVDSNGVVYAFDEPPKRIAITNTYAATVMKMLDVDPSVVVGVSGDFESSDL